MLTLANMCEASGDCHTHLESLTSAVRGLFLLAYQGENYVPRNEVDFDWSIPRSYYRILNASLSSFTPVSLQADVPVRSSISSSTNHDSPCIKVAFLSAYYFRHSVGRLMGNMILSLNRTLFDVTIISSKNTQNSQEDKKKDDDLTAKLKKNVATWIDLSHIFDRDVNLIRGLHCDVIVFGDLLMHAYTAHLLSRRLASVQVAFWGHPFSAGSSSIDYFVSSNGFQEEWSTARMKKVDSEFYEQLVLMDTYSADVLADREYEVMNDGRGEKNLDSVFKQHHDLGSRAKYVEYVVSRGSDLFNRPSQYDWRGDTNVDGLHIYTCLQSIMKMHPLFDEVLVQLLTEDSSAVVILLSSLKSKFISQLKFQRRLLTAILLAGADPRRVIFMPQIPTKVYSQVVCGADVTLDPLPFGGGVTLSDSIRCNVPFVTSSEYE